MTNDTDDLNVVSHEDRNGVAVVAEKIQWHWLNFWMKIKKTNDLR